nr:protein kinase C-binding protein 1-like isoform X1 [Megalopta genalis]XP_033331760.1 protein kinase C-binding protein 1-like isoform X1 [Megalopta genalis]XP_033331761.1 protein kinase C-binding protein 1-like isoform X1 [Megalopta genalis]XP_033331762.1 protein kinase C-binding protein 1-like isoform X1 [Megalopta genalis]XP_033331763.1 protein kinase C-binding protein 1-like isoform X1 [Megalopta genalis]XP_033331764.1 protein kinase C-binding protein 1-like isoform X1 [Megalopta genalis]
MKMTSTKAEGTFTNSLQQQCPITSKIENSKSVNTQIKDKKSITDADTKGIIKKKNEATDCDAEKMENEEEVIILERNKEEIKCNIDKVECVQNIEKSDVLTPVSKNNPRINKNSSTKETPTIKSANNLKRKQRNLIVQEAESPSEENNLRSKRKKRNTNDRFCWRCHKESVEAHCSACPRSWHRKCIGMQSTSIQNWICGECAAILRAENAETRSTAMAQLSVDQLCLLLKHVVERMREYPGSEPFWKPVELSDAPNYMDYVVKPMDLSLLESNVRAKLYGSTDAFMADAKWIQHNCIVFNTCGGVYTDTSKLTNAAKQMIKLARQEVSEIEACPDCYAHGRNLPRPQPSWFIEPCRRPHPLVWAKLKGFPFWPAKAMPRINSQGFVDVRFFGEHDRAWVPPRDLYLYSEDPPVPLPRKRKLDMEECVREITRHCRKLELVFGQFKFAPPKVQYNPHDPMQIKLMLPNYDPLRSNNYPPSEFLTPKKKPFLKKRLHGKVTKSQSDSEKTDNSDTENKTSTECDPSPESNKVDDKLPKVQDPERSSEVELISVSSNGSNTSMNSNESIVKEEDTSIDKSTFANSTTTNEEDSKPGSSKIVVNPNNGNEKDALRKVDSSKSNAVITEQNNNAGKLANDSTILLESLLKEEPKDVGKHSTDEVHVIKKESSLLKAHANKSETNQCFTNSLQKSNLKVSKPVGKVYKPKTRMVDKVNAEKALKSSGSEESQILVKQIDAMSLKGSSKHSDSDVLSSSSVSISPGNKARANEAETAQISKQNAVLSSALLFVMNNGTFDATAKKSIGSSSISEKERIDDVSTIQQRQSDPVQISHQKKESKARKSLPKTRACPQLIPHSSASLLSNSIDSIVYNMPAHQTENGTEYQMLPPEAGPVSARLYHGAQDLARKMAQLMEEAYKEAARGNQNSESTTSENHQATVHFLRLQIERMRWQHQQQLAELKHNTDRILREMKASLEAERLRAIEETRKEAEEEKLRCIEDIKRKQWCAMCGREAVFYCCWNTAYCDYPCQQSHWPTHMRTCAQKPSFTTIVTSSAANANQQQVMPRLMINTQHVTSNIWRA